MQTTRLSTFWRATALVATSAVVLGGCAGTPTEAPVPAGGAPASQQALSDGNIPPTGVEGGPDFDLSGMEVVATTSPPGAVNAGTFFAYKRLEEWGADVETVIITTTSGVQTIVAGRADLASQGSDEVVLGAAEGADMVAIGSPSTAIDYVLVARDGFDTVESLQGQAIGTSGPSGFDALLARFALEDVGLSASDANFVQIGGSPDRAAALLTGQVQAAAIFLEDWEELRQQDESLVLVQYLAELVPEVPSTAYFADRSYWDENPQVALALACANLQANAWIAEDEDRWVDYVLQIVPGATEDATHAIYQAGQEIDMWPTEADRVFTADGLSGLVDAMVATDEISTAVDAEEATDESYLLEAEEMGCGQS